MVNTFVISGLAAATTIGALTAAGPPEADASAPQRLADAAPSQVDAPVPDIDWGPCEESLRCATVQVPLDYDDPAGRTTELALAKHEARDPDARIGTMFVNPGGPGGSAVEYTPWYVDNLPAEVVEQFDVVGIDPRGVGAVLHCDAASRAKG